MRGWGENAEQKSCRAGLEGQKKKIGQRGDSWEVEQREKQNTVGLY